MIYLFRDTYQPVGMYVNSKFDGVSASPPCMESGTAPPQKATSLELHTFLLLFAGGTLAGVINVIVGGAGFMTFPLLVAAGMSEIEANASNFVAVLPANVVGTYAYRSELASVRKHLGFGFSLPPLGGIVGSTILIYTGQASFQKAIPWLLLFATLSFLRRPLVQIAA